MLPNDPMVKALLPLTSRLRTDVTAKKGANGPVWTDEKLTDALVAKHLNGGPARGCCPIKAGESVTMAGLFDMDSHKGEVTWPDMVGHAKRIMETMEMVGLTPIPFRSSGGHGIHIFSVWDDPQDAYSVRQLMQQVLEACGFKNGDGGVAKGQVEIFPKQDSVDVSGKGNMFILPGAGKSVPLEPLLDLEPLEKTDLVRVQWTVSDPVPIVERPERSGSGGRVGLEALESALDAIPNSGENELAYEQWRDVIFAIHHETDGSDEGLALAEKFSAKSSKHDKKFLEQRTWRHIKGRDDGITGRTVLTMAQQHGWTDPTEVFDMVVDDTATVDNGIDSSPPKLRRDGNGAILATIENVVAALSKPGYCGMEIRHDDFKDEIVYAAAGDNQWFQFGDNEYTKLRIALERRGFKPIGRELVRDAVGLVAMNNRFDTAIEWLNQLQWDGVSRIETFLSRYFGAEDTPYTRAVSLYIWSALAARVLHPGAKADIVPILIGEQGSGKSTGVSAMVPDPQHFTEISFNEKEEDLARKMRGRLLGEIGELRGLHTKELESIKAFLTRTHENWVPKYKEFATVFPRRLLFIGTTNQHEFLADSTGNRRMAPVTVGRTDLDALTQDRLQLWAEGAVFYMSSGVAYQLAEQLARDIHHNHEITDPWTEHVDAWLDCVDAFTGEYPRKKAYLTTGEILQGALAMEKKAIGKREEMRAAVVLKKLGYTRKKMRVQGKGAWVFVPTVPHLDPT